MVFYLYAFISYLIPTTFFGPFYFLQDLEHTFQLVYFNVFQQSQNCETGNIYARVPIQYEFIQSFIHYRIYEVKICYAYAKICNKVSTNC